MRRALILSLGGILLFCAAAGAGMLLATRAGPPWLHAAVEESLSRTFSTPVRVGATRLRLGPATPIAPGLPPLPAITLEAEDLSAWPGDEGPALRAGRLRAPLDPAALLSGRLRFSLLDIEGLGLTLRRAPDGHFHPPLLSPELRGPLGFLERLFAADLPAPSIELRDARFTLEDETNVGPEGPERLRFEHLTLRLLAPGLVQPGRLHVTATLVGTDGPGARFELEAVPPDASGPPFALAVSELPLPRLARWLPGLSALDPGGRVSGVLELERGDGGATDVALDLQALGVALRTADDAAPLRFDRLALATRLAVSDEAIRVGVATLHADALSLALEGRLGLPVDDDAALAVVARVPELALPTVRALAPGLPRPARMRLEEALAALADGRLLDLELETDTTVGRARELAAGGFFPLPPGTRLSTTVTGIALEVDGTRLERIEGAAQLEAPDRLLVSQLSGWHDDVALPQLDLRLDGLGAVLAATAEPWPVMTPMAPLPGWATLVDLVRPDATDPEGPAWHALEVDAEWILLPVFLRPLREVRARFAPTPDGVSGEIEHARWGGVAIRGHGRLEVADGHRLVLAIAAEPPPPGPLRPPAAESWLRGRARIETTRGARPGLGVTHAEGLLDAAASVIFVAQGEAALTIPGRVRGDLRLDLGHADRVPIDTRFTLSGLDATDVATALGLAPDAAAGSLELRARLVGPLYPERPLFAELDGEAWIEARDGELGVELPWLLALAKASTTFDPFGSKRGLRFREIQADLQIEDGTFSTRRTIAIDSPDLRLAISGSLDVTATPPRLEAVVGTFFFRPLDRVLGVMPVVSRILLGPDRSLFGTYFELTGPWSDPNAGIIPTKTVALGPASFLLEDVPAFVQSGVRAITEALQGDARAPEVAAPAEPPRAEAGNGS